MTERRGEASASRSQLATRYAVLVAVSALVVLADQVVKAIVTARLQGEPPIDLFSGAVLLNYTRNSGAAFGILRAGGLLFEAVGVCVSVGIVFTYPRVPDRARFVRVGLGLILGGAVGNVADRFRLGYVVDFIDLRWWPVFNLADSAIVIGVSLLLLQTMGGSRARE